MPPPVRVPSGKTRYNPKITHAPGTATCLGCGHVQADTKARDCCEKCCMSPMPSRHYVSDSGGLKIY